MLGIMKKNLSFFVQYIGLLYPLMILYWFLRRDAFDLPALLTTGFFLFTDFRVGEYSGKL